MLTNKVVYYENLPGKNRLPLQKYILIDAPTGGSEVKEKGRRGGERRGGEEKRGGKWNFESPLQNTASATGWLPLFPLTHMHTSELSPKCLTI